MDLLVKAFELNEYLKTLDEVKKVYESEKRMEEDEETRILIFKYQNAITNYNDAVRYNLDLTTYQKHLSEAKEELYKSQLVKEYLDNLKIANALLENIKNEIFKDIIDFDSSLKSCLK